MWATKNNKIFSKPTVNQVIVKEVVGDDVAGIMSWLGDASGRDLQLTLGIQRHNTYHRQSHLQ